MNQLFYAHLVPLDESLALLDQYQLSPAEHAELEELIYAMFDHRVMDTILVSLPPEHHDELMRRVAEAPHDLSIIVFIKQYVPQIDSHLQLVGNELGLDLRGLLHKMQEGGANV